MISYSEESVHHLDYCWHQQNLNGSAGWCSSVTKATYQPDLTASTLRAVLPILAIHFVLYVIRCVIYMIHKYNMGTCGTTAVAATRLFGRRLDSGGSGSGSGSSSLCVADNRLAWLVRPSAVCHLQARRGRTGIFHDPR